MRSEVEKAAHKEQQKRKYAEKVRLTIKPWTYVEVCRLVSEWMGGTLNDGYSEYTTLWTWLEIRAGKEDKKLIEMPTTKGGVKLSLEYLLRVQNDTMTDHTTRNLREKCGVKLDDYLLWSESELAAFVFRCENLIEADRMERQAHVVRKVMINGIKEGDNKKIQQWLEMTGRAKADLKDTEGFVINVVETYNVPEMNQTNVVQLPKAN